MPPAGRDFPVQSRSALAKCQTSAFSTPGKIKFVSFWGRLLQLTFFSFFPVSVFNLQVKYEAGNVNDILPIAVRNYKELLKVFEA